MARLFVIEIVCDCHAHINLRYIQEKNGDKHYVRCWRCNKIVEANGTSVKIEGRLINRNRVFVIMNEPYKKDL
jgi:hypothetical protein